MRAWLTLLIVGAMLAPSVSSATCENGTDANTWCSGPDTSGRTVTSLAPGRVAYYDFNDTTDPPCIAVEEGRSVSYEFNADEDGASSGATVVPYRSSENSLSTNHGQAIYNDTDGDGLPNALPLDGVTELRKGREDVFIQAYFCLDVTANPNSDDARFVLRSH